MAGNRKAAQAQILSDLEEILPGSQNIALYKARFDKMSDKQFDDFMKGLKEGTERLSLIAANFDKVKLTVPRNLATGKKWGHDFFQRVWMPAENGAPRFLTPIKYLILKLPIRRQAQHLIKKISIPEDNKSVDDLTGQPTGKSKGSKISYPEFLVLASHGLDKTIKETMTMRGGDTGAFNAMNRALAQKGSVSFSEVEPFSTGVESTKTFNALLTACHLSNTL